MGLSWDVHDVKVVPETQEERAAWYEQVSYDQPGVPEQERLTNWQLIDTLIWRSMVLGWGWKLKPALVQTVIERNEIYEVVNAGQRIAHLPPAFLADMVGIQTNVGPITDAEFFKNIRRQLAERGRNAWRRHVEAVEKAAQTEAADA